MRSAVEQQLANSLPSNLVAELLDAYDEAKRSYYLGGLRLAEVEGGRFCEAVFRILEYIAFVAYTPIGTSLKTEPLIKKLQNIPTNTQPEAIRIHIPRSLRLVYDIRNKRDAAHLGDGIDPNLQDSTVVISVLDWVLAELIRLHHNVSADKAYEIVSQIVTRMTPVVEDFDGFLKVLNPKLKVADHCLVLLYQCNAKGATFQQLHTWARPSMRPNLRRTLTRLVEERDLLHFDGTTYLITTLGIRLVEKDRLAEPWT